jgi:hypothetical protein
LAFGLATRRHADRTGDHAEKAAGPAWSKKTPTAESRESVVGAPPSADVLDAITRQTGVKFRGQHGP